MSQIKISGFTFIKHGLTLGYPFLESVQSIAPFCDEIIVNVGFDDPELKKDDGTFQHLEKNLLGPKYKILKSYWNPQIKEKGLILSEQTNIALKECQGDYCQYIQGDEAIHENDRPMISDGVSWLDKNSELDGLVFNYLHFYGNIDIIRRTRKVYRREIRLIRNGKNIISWLDAQGFRYHDGSKIPCVQIGASIYHYGWARKEIVMNKKVKTFGKLYHGDQFENPDFTYQRIWGLERFKQTHPQCMQTWIAAHHNPLDIMQLPLSFHIKDLGLVFSDAIEKITGFRLGEYKGYKIRKKI
ncbi:MAG: hypothetical protein HYV97_17230 [Bdellovibrio sp.]|nr:hypothetical protein [Bdellovibrio sp.]